MSEARSPKTMGKKLVLCSVRLLDDQEVTFQLDHKAVGQELHEAVANHLNLLESDYFGLEYFNARKHQYWVDPEKPILKQVSDDPKFSFCVKFYTPDPGQLEEEYTRYLFALQIKKDLSQGILVCSDNTAALLASYIAQAELGDYRDEYGNNPVYLSHIKFIPKQAPDMERKIMEYHKNHVGQLPADADLNLLDVARKVELYGIRMHPAKDHEAVSLNLAVSHSGVLVFQNVTKINTFSWAKIRKLSFKRKKFLIKLHPDGYGYYKDTVEFYFDCRDESKNFWKKCIEHHAFFRCVHVKKGPRSKGGIMSRGSSFRYSGRTQKQLNEYARAHFGKNRPFESSMRTLASAASRNSRSPPPGHAHSATLPLLPSDTLRSRNSTMSSGSHTLRSGGVHSAPAGRMDNRFINDEDEVEVDEVPRPNERMSSSIERMDAPERARVMFSDAYAVEHRSFTQPPPPVAVRKSAASEDEAPPHPRKSTTSSMTLPSAFSSTGTHAAPSAAPTTTATVERFQPNAVAPPERIIPIHRVPRGYDEQKPRNVSVASEAPPAPSPPPHYDAVTTTPTVRTASTADDSFTKPAPTHLVPSEVTTKREVTRSVTQTTQVIRTTFTKDGEKADHEVFTVNHSQPLAEHSSVVTTEALSQFRGPSLYDERAPSTHSTFDPHASMGHLEDEGQRKSRSISDKAYFIAKELLMTERTYKKDLEVVVVWFRNAFNADNTLPELLSHLLFTVFNPLYEMHCNFLKEVEQRLALWESRASMPTPGEQPIIGDLMEACTLQVLQMYKIYIDKYDEILLEIEAASKRHRRFEQGLKDFETQKVCYLPFSSFILKPALRLLHYRALLQRLIDHYSPGHPDFHDTQRALSNLEKIVPMLEKSLKRAENIQKLVELQKDLVGIESLLQGEREFIREGCLHKFSKKGYQQKMFILFNDVLLYCGRVSSPVLQFKVYNELPVNAVMIEDSERNFNIPNCFTVNTSTKSYVVAASSEGEKHKWMADLADTIDHAKVYNAENQQYASLKSHENLDADESDSKRSNKAIGPQHRSNTTLHVCWHRNTSVGAGEQSKANRCQLSGYLLRKFKNSNGWQKLWVVFTNFCLFFYKTYQDDFPLASLPLLGYTVSTPQPEDSINKDFVFKLKFKTHVYFFRAESQYTFERWVEMIGRATRSDVKASSRNNNSIIQPASHGGF